MHREQNYLANFGVFDVRITNERTNARNPKTKENVTIPRRKKIVFKAGKNIKNEITLYKNYNILYIILNMSTDSNFIENFTNYYTYILYVGLFWCYKYS